MSISVEHERFTLTANKTCDCTVFAIANTVKLFIRDSANFSKEYRKVPRVRIYEVRACLADRVRQEVTPNGHTSTPQT